MDNPNSRMYETLLNRDQVAEMLNCSVMTVRRLEANGKIPRVEITGMGIRYRPSSIQAFIESKEFYKPSKLKSYGRT